MDHITHLVKRKSRKAVAELAQHILHGLNVQYSDYSDFPASCRYLFISSMESSLSSQVEKRPPYAPPSIAYSATKWKKIQYSHPQAPHLPRRAVCDNASHIEQPEDEDGPGAQRSCVTYAIRVQKCGTDERPYHDRYGD